MVLLLTIEEASPFMELLYKKLPSLIIAYYA